MARILVYAAPGHGELFPLVPALKLLNEKGHEVIAKVPSVLVLPLLKLGINATALAENVECTMRSDYQQFSHQSSLQSLLEHMIRRGDAEIPDLEQAFHDYVPNIMLINANCFGANAAAEAWNFPRMSWATCLLPFPAQGIPPFGLGMPYQRSAFSAFNVKNWGKAGAVQKSYDQVLDMLNYMRQSAGAKRLSTVLEWPARLNHLLYFTAEPFEYERSWPDSVHLIGPGSWEPYEETIKLDEDDRPIILASCCCEYQDEQAMVNCILQGLDPDMYQVIITTAGVSPDIFEADPKFKLVRYAAHNPILEKASCVICPGNLGLVQKALMHGVPVMAIPHYREQTEIGQRLKHHQAGTVLPMDQLRPSAIESCLQKTIEMKPGATKLQQFFAQYNSAELAAGLVNEYIEHIAKELEPAESH